jgi:hypothetical protein
VEKRIADLATARGLINQKQTSGLPVHELDISNFGEETNMKTLWTTLVVLTLAAASLAAFAAGRAKAEKKAANRVFELRTYYAHPGKMDALNARFRDHTCKLFEKHGMTIVGFWNPSDPKQAESKLVYLLAFPSREAADQSWKAFRDDPEWKSVRAASEKEGPLVARLESLYLNPTDYSPLK